MCEILLTHYGVLLPDLNEVRDLLSRFRKCCPTSSDVKIAVKLKERLDRLGLSFGIAQHRVDVHEDFEAIRQSVEEDLNAIYERNRRLIAPNQMLIEKTLLYSILTKPLQKNHHNCLQILPETHTNQSSKI
jgi:hypothetical protein